MRLGRRRLSVREPEGYWKGENVTAVRVSSMFARRRCWVSTTLPIWMELMAPYAVYGAPVTIGVAQTPEVSPSSRSALRNVWTAVAAVEQTVLETTRLLMQARSKDGRYIRPRPRRPVCGVRRDATTESCGGRP